MALTYAALTRRTIRAVAPAAFLPTPGLAEEARPQTWAQPVPLEGALKLYQITPTLYRSAQPTAEGFHKLATLGIKSIISLRQTVNDTPLAAGTGLTLTRIPMKSRYVAEKNGAKVVAVMQALYTGLSQGPTLIHCHHGADRTGLIAALYRVLDEGWSREEALRELNSGGYGFHSMWANIPRYLSCADLTALKSRIAT